LFRGNGRGRGKCTESGRRSGRSGLRDLGNRHTQGDIARLINESGREKDTAETTKENYTGGVDVDLRLEDTHVGYNLEGNVESVVERE
jgi:hypothetical protein